jgi:glutaredoxin
LLLTIYSKPGCHLCDEMKTIVHQVTASQSDTSIEEIDISTDSELFARYSLEIPVLLIDGRKVAKYRVSEEQLRRIISSRA